MTKETEGATAPLRNKLLAIMARGRISAVGILNPEDKGPHGLTEAEAREILKWSALEYCYRNESN